jgi:Helix-turn-helix of DDE superfamily endonuclease
MPSYEEVTQRAGSVRAMTGLTPQEFTALLPHFEHAFLAYMKDHTIDGQPRTNRRYSTYDTSPLPTMADKLLFILTYLKQNPIQEVQGQLFGMSQSNANKWLHLLHTVLNQALAHQDLLPARTADELAALLAKHRPEVPSPSPLFGMMVLSDRSTDPPIPRNNRNTIVARRSATRSKTSL